MLDGSSRWARSTTWWRRHATAATTSRCTSGTAAPIPGLINAHTHLQYCDYRAMAATGLPFPAWIAETTRRREHTTDEEWASAATWGAAGAPRTGTTAVADVVTDSPAVAPVRTSGLQGISYLEMVSNT